MESMAGAKVEEKPAGAEDWCYHFGARCLQLLPFPPGLLPSPSSPTRHAGRVFELMPTTLLGWFLPKHVLTRIATLFSFS